MMIKGRLRFQFNGMYGIYDINGNTPYMDYGIDDIYAYMDYDI
jgi:hypothetical protein